MTAASPALPFTLPAIKRSGTSPFYLLAMLLVACGMVLLVLLYAAVACTIAWLIHWHLTHEQWSMVFAPKAGLWDMLFALAGLMVDLIGSALVLFMLKPFLLEPPHKQVLDTVDERTQPQLMRFIHAVCDSVGAPHPSIVELSCTANAAAALRHGWGSIFGNQLTLVIGLPLVAGFTQRELAGVLAHEFGHFHQTAGMRLTFMIRSINSWFVRSAFEYDWFDAKILQGAASSDRGISLLFSAVMLGTTVSRRIIRLFVYAGQAISSSMSRQMEFDADKCEALVAGSSQFAITTERVSMLGMAEEIAKNDVLKALQSGEIADDFPALIVAREKMLPPELRNHIRREIGDSQTKWWNTHPADGDRILAAEKLRAPGIFHDERPASLLFANFTRLCKELTISLYDRVLDVNLSNVTFCDVDTITGEQSKRSKRAWASIEAWFGEGHVLRRAKPLPAVPNYDWHQLRAYMQINRNEHESRLSQAKELNTRAYYQQLAVRMLGYKYRINPSAYHVPEATLEAAEQAYKQSQSELAVLEAAIAEFDHAALARLVIVLAALEQEDCTPEQRAHRHRLIHAQRALAAGRLSMYRCSTLATMHETLRKALEINGPSAEVDRHRDEFMNEVLQRMNEYFATLAPLEHPYLDGFPSLIAAVPQLPEYADTAERAQKLLAYNDDVFTKLLARITGDLCALAIEAEERLAPKPQAK